MSGDTIMIVMVATYVVVGLVSLIIGYRMVKALFRIAKAGLSLFGDSLTTQVISLGVASFVFSRALPAVFAITIDFFARLISGFSAALSRPLATVSDINGDSAVRMTTKAVVAALNSCADAFTSALTGLTAFPIGDLLLLLALGAIIGLFLRTVESQAAGGGKRIWLFQYIAGLSPVARKNTAFAIVLIVAGYLSAASLAAIPALQEPAAAPTEVSKERLQELLQKIKTEAGGTTTAQGVNLTSPFAMFETWVEETRKSAADSSSSPPPVTPTPTPTATPTPTPAVTEESGEAGTTATTPVRLSPELPTPPKHTPFSQYELGMLDSILRTAKDRRQNALSNYQRLVAALRDGSESALSTALSAYETENVDRRGRREAVRYFQEIADWYRRKLTSTQGRVSDALRNLQQGDDAATQNLSLLQHSLAQAEDARFRDTILSSALSYTSGVYRSYFVEPDFDDSLPQRPKLGSYLGPFAFLASWLLGAESLPLALIVGLVGFGLLGSACSTLIRQRSQNRIDGALVSDLTRVVIPGLSAAVVVFLVVEGGLSIFASGSGQPNPYVLFLICLVASVFSEVVWNWAQPWLERSLPGADKRKDPSKKHEKKTGVSSEPKEDRAEKGSTEGAEEP